MLVRHQLGNNFPYHILIDQGQVRHSMFRVYCKRLSYPYTIQYLYCFGYSTYAFTFKNNIY